MFDPYDEGWEDYYNGLGLENNPYDYYTEEYADWQAGWLAAGEEDFI